MDAEAGGLQKVITPDHCGINMLFPEAYNSQVHLGVYPVAALNNSMHQSRIIERDTAVFQWHASSLEVAKPLNRMCPEK